ncbi:Alba-like protein C9orf23-like protein [Morus notabilis]|uniref:Alba-like protein C9orf23-like protein n=1 Tax=Morus notabilis TaxID=981085 RepID=W9SB58_9ROSA|nr:Alba-like protein C9orf23-like protein [Morus notabilis]
MDRYQRVEKPKPESPINENEIRITTQGVIRNYISYATTLLQEKRARDIVLKAMGQAISKTVAIAEIIKKRIPRLHQETAISSVSITDVWEPIEEGLVPVEMTRHVSMISITLSTKELDKTSPGYQAPYQMDQSRPQPNYQQQIQQPKQARAPYNAINEEAVGGVGIGVGMATTRVGMEITKEDMETIKVVMGTIKIMVDIQIGAEAEEAEVGAIVVQEQDMKEAEVEGAEDMGVAEDGWVADRGVVATRRKSAVGVIFALAKCLPVG